MHYNTKGNASPRDKVNVFFSAHPADFEESYERICADLLEADENIAVWYLTQEERSAYDPELLRTDLGCMELFVFPVTDRLLKEPNAARDTDLPFAKSEHIPILPILAEPVSDALYARGDLFGPIQYLDPLTRDETAIGYEEKLRKFLRSFTVSSDVADRVRGAFDAYAFLSYRKKDRKYANDLMRLIHSDPALRDIAIWYDEYLIPGEAFDEAIMNMLEKSDLFTLLVTPNLVDEDNFVQRVEYPRAQKSGLPVVPVEMKETDGTALGTSFPELPECVSPDAEGALREEILKAIGRIADPENDRDPVHNYLIGLAYRSGIDVEVDRERAAQLIEEAAAAGYADAMIEIAAMYEKGWCVEQDYGKAVIWYEKGVDALAKTLDPTDKKLLNNRVNLANLYMTVGRIPDAMEIYQDAFEIWKGIPEAERDVAFGVTCMNNLGTCYYEQGDYEKSLALDKWIYMQSVRIRGEEDPKTIEILQNVLCTRAKLYNDEETLKLVEEALALSRRVLGEEHSLTLSFYNNYADLLQQLGKADEAVLIYRKLLEIRRRTLGEDDPTTLIILHNLGVVVGSAGDPEQAAELLEEAYTRRKRIFGEENPDTMSTLSMIALQYMGMRDFQGALERLLPIFESQSHILGLENRSVILTMHNIACCYMELADYETALKWFDKVLEGFVDLLGPDHVDTLRCMDMISVTYCKAGDLTNAIGYEEEAAEHALDTYGPDHPVSNRILQNLASYYLTDGSNEEAKETLKILIESYERIYGEDSEQAMQLKEFLATL